MRYIKVTAHSVVFKWGQILCFLHQSFLSSLAINRSTWGHSLQSFPLVSRFPGHNSPGSRNYFFVPFIDKTEKKTRLNYFLPSPGTSLSIPKQRHLCRAPDQWTLSSGDFNHINTTAEQSPSDSPVLKWQAQHFCQLLHQLLGRLIYTCGQKSICHSYRLPVSPPRAEFPLQEMQFDSPDLPSLWWGLAIFRQSWGAEYKNNQ